MLLLISTIIVFVCIVGALAFSLRKEAELAERSRMFSSEHSDGGQPPLLQIVRAERDDTGTLAGGVYVLLLLLVLGLIGGLAVLLVPSDPSKSMRPGNLLMLVLFSTVIPLLYSNARRSFALSRLVAQLPQYPSLRLYRDRIAIPANFVIDPQPLFIALNSPEVICLLRHIKGWHLGLANVRPPIPLLRLDCGSNMNISIVANYLDGREQEVVALLRDLGVPEDTAKHER